MQFHKIPYQETGYFSPLILDYLSGNKELNELAELPFDFEAFEKAINNKKQKPVNRKELFQAIETQYEGIEKSTITGLNISSLKDENTFCIVTAHQLSIFTGPLYYILKIANTIRICNDLKTRFPTYVFVPVYWMGSEDHDFEEVSKIHVFGKSLTWEDRQGGALGEYKIDGLQEMANRLQEILGDNPNSNALTDIFKEAYNTGNLSLGTRKLVNALFGEYGLVVVDGNDRSLKSLFTEVIRNELTESISSKIVQPTIQKITGLGYKQQAVPRDINLFYLGKNSRERIVKENNQYKVLNTGIEFSEDEILQELKDNPQHFSPNVILRPLYQQMILPALAYVGGGGELAYWMQLKDLFQNFRVPFPMLVLRSSVMIVNNSTQKRMEKLDISQDSIFQPLEKLKKDFIAGKAGEELDISSEIIDLATIFEELKEEAKIIDPTLVSFISAEHKKTENSLEMIKTRLEKAKRQKFDIEISQIEKLKLSLFPEGELQERVENISTFWQTYGSEIIKVFIENLNPFDKEFIVISA